MATTKLRPSMALQQRAAHLQRKSRSRFRFAKHHFHPSQWTWRPWKSRTASKHVSAGRWELLPAANPGVNRFTVPPEEMEAEWTGHEWNVMNVVQTAEQRKLHDTLQKDTSSPARKKPKERVVERAKASPTADVVFSGMQAEINRLKALVELLEQQGRTATQEKAAAPCGHQPQRPAQCAGGRK